MTRPAPGSAATSSSTPVATSSHSRAPTGSGYQISSACRCLSCTSAPSRHSSAAFPLRAPGFARGLRSRDSPTCDVQLVDRVERAHGVAGEHVGETGREPTPGHHTRARARGRRRRARGARRASRRDRRRGVRHPRGDGRGGPAPGSTSPGNADAIASMPAGSGSSRPSCSGSAPSWRALATSRACSSRRARRR